jgi:hypothetical protein
MPRLASTTVKDLSNKQVAITAPVFVLSSSFTTPSPSGVMTLSFCRIIGFSFVFASGTKTVPDAKYSIIYNQNMYMIAAGS